MMQEQTHSPAVAVRPSSHWSTEISGLAELYQSHINVVVCKRSLDEGISRFVQASLLGSDWDTSLCVHPERCNFESLFPQPEATGLRADLTLLVELFAELVGASDVGVRFLCQSAAGCPRFHVDRVTARMVCTYYGAGTEWLEQHAARRAYLGHASRGIPDERSGLIAGPIQQMKAFEIGILKGERWPGNEGRGAVHRSPAAGDARRLFVSLDAL